MPIYEYVCPTCGEFERMQKISEPALTVCPMGHAGVERKISATGFILKGSGWYVTDYARKGAGTGGVANGAGGAGARSEKGETAGSSKGTGESKATTPAGEAKTAAS